MRRFCHPRILVAVFAATPPLYAQWFDIADPQSDTVCGVVNAADDALLVIGEDSQLVLIRSTDLSLANTAIDEYLFVYIDDEATGAIDFATDSHGRRRAFWITEIGTLYGLTPTGEAVATDVYPDEVEGFCDPCEFWDDQADCLDAEETDSDSSAGGALLSGLCGAGSASAVALTMLGLLALTVARSAIQR